MSKSKKEKTAVDRIVDQDAITPDDQVTNTTNYESPRETEPLGEEKENMSELENKDGVTANQDGMRSDSAVTGNMNLATLQGLYGENFGVSGYKLMAAKPSLLMPQEMPVIEWLNNCKNNAFSPIDLVAQGTELLRVDVARYNGIASVFSFQGAEWAIHLGKILIKLKVLVRKSNQIWGGWAATNLPFIGDRTREKMMRLARRKDCWRYSILGPERLDVLCAAIPVSTDGSNAIGSFLERHQIPFDPTREFDLDEFKRQIDHALAQEKLNGKGITLPPQKVAALVDSGYQIDGAAIKEFQTIQRSGGDLGLHADYLITTGGRAGSNKTPQQRLQDVNTLASRLTKSIGFILANQQDLIDQIDRDIYRKLLEKLNEISLLRNMETDYTQATA
jgi:hypothetical protein